MKRLSSINLSRISFRSFLFSCSMFFACANTHAASFSLSKILTMGMLFVASQTQGNNHPEVCSMGLTGVNNPLEIHSCGNEVMNNSNLTNSYTALTVCNNDTFSPSTLRLIDSEGNSVECSFEARKRKFAADISCKYKDLKVQNLSLATCDDNNKCVMLPMPDKTPTSDYVVWSILGFYCVFFPTLIISLCICNPREAYERKERQERERVKLLEVTVKRYEQRMDQINKLCKD